MDDIRPPKLTEAKTDSHVTSEAQQGRPSKQTPRKKRRYAWYVCAGLGAFILAATISVSVWYSWAIGQVGMDSKEMRVVVEQGSAAADIATTLKGQGLIKSKLAFTTYVQLSGNRSKLQAGGYVLSPSMNVQEIVEHLATGKTDELNITIPPGLTLKELREQFKKNGFSDDEITQAFNSNYAHPVLAGRPAGATLEGYIYPETYRIRADEPLNGLITRSLDELYKKLQSGGILEEFGKRGLTIHQGITLASMVQKEVSGPADQKQVAQVFLKRLADGVQLGSDVTFIYAARELGVEATPALDSPYNTRLYSGLPPGPIANMNPSALEAVAFPAPGDFVYFVAGDDGVTYFARTEAEHNANVSAHCTTLCQ